ncbi:hypothetical protein CFK41_07690 [Brachybacterium ginsengisoli]|uniref:Ig-like domain-containing protein n=1 Tax=Brachybacterium ginsengisoli TaxID=1331682 RepID=A0A291GWR7_9MICO|nr:hypothetical protein [Brachybacterium ginsengisoli]ATG54660.1 hypothetical protein CFK41_07690 [Brachybacterium ginsengisoli]
MTAPSPSPTPPSGPDHFTPPPAPSASASSSKRNLLLAGILGGAGCLLVLLLVIVLIVTFVVRGGGPASGDDGSETADLSPEEQATALVSDYFAALTEGDAAAALEVAPLTEDQASEALPLEAYEKALELAPVADVEVGTPTVDGSGLAEATIPVSFTVGGEPVRDTFSMWDFDGDGILEMTWAGVNETVGDGATALGTTLNGVELTDGQQVALLPGGYELAYGTENLAPSTAGPLIVGAWDSVPEWPAPEVTEKGLTAFRGAVRTAVDDCLEKTTPEAGCGIAPLATTTSDGWTMVEGTVKRSISEDSQHTIDTMEATPAVDDPTSVEGSSIGTVETSFECTKDGQRDTCDLWFGGDTGIPRVDLADPDLPVTWI